MSASRSPSISRQAIFASGTPDGLRHERDGARGARVGLDHVQLVVAVDGELDVDQADHAEPQRDLGRRRPRPGAASPARATSPGSRRPSRRSARPASSTCCMIAPICDSRRRRRARPRRSRSRSRGSGRGRSRPRAGRPRRCARGSRPARRGSSRSPSRGRRARRTGARAAGSRRRSAAVERLVGRVGRGVRRALEPELVEQGAEARAVLGAGGSTRPGVPSSGTPASARPWAELQRGLAAELHDHALRAARARSRRARPRA